MVADGFYGDLTDEERWTAEKASRAKSYKDNEAVADFTTPFDTNFPVSKQRKLGVCFAD